MNQNDVPYQSLMKVYLAERVVEERGQPGMTKPSVSQALWRGHLTVTLPVLAITAVGTALMYVMLARGW